MLYSIALDADCFVTNDDDSEEQAKAGFNQFMEELGAKYPEMVTWWMEYVKYSCFV